MRSAILNVLRLPLIRGPTPKGFSSCIALFLVLCLSWSDPGLATDFLYPAHGFFSDPWGTGEGLPALGAYTTGRHGLPEPALPGTPGSKILAHLRSLPALTNWALLHNPQTASAWAGLGAQAAALGIAKGLWLPTVSVGIGGQRSGDILSRGFSPPLANTMNATLSLNEVLYDFGQRAAAISKAESAVLIARYEANAAIQQVALTVANAYYALAGAEARVRVYRQGVKEAQTIYADTRLQYRAHLKPITDMYQAQTERSQAREQLVIAQGTEQSDRGALAQAAGLPVAMHLPIGTLQSPRQRLSIGIRRWLRSAVRKNPSILSDLATIREAREAIFQAEAQGLPSISLVGNLGQNQYQSQQPNVKIYSVGLQLNIPFDTNFTTEYQVKEDRALYRQAHAQARQETDTILLEVWQAYAGLKSAMGAYVNAQQQVISAKNALSGIRTEYRIGLANILELITAEQNLIQAGITSASELANYYEYQADLYRYAGLIPDRSR